MDNFERTFSELAGRKATPRELDDLRRIKNMLRLSDHDALWPILILLESQVTSNALIASRIEQAAERYQKTIEQTGAQAEELIERTRAAGHARVDSDAEPVKALQVAGFVLFLALVGWGLFSIYDWGRDNAIDKVRAYNPQVASRVFAPLECGPE